MTMWSSSKRKRRKTQREATHEKRQGDPVFEEEESEIVFRNTKLMWSLPRKTGNSKHWLRCAQTLPAQSDRLSTPSRWTRTRVPRRCSPWWIVPNGRDRVFAEPNMPPSLAQMFALARRMGYEMRPVARRVNQPPGSPRLPFPSGQGYRQPFRQGWDFSKIKCFSCGQMGHTQARCPKSDATLPFKAPGWGMQVDPQQ